MTESQSSQVSGPERPGPVGRIGRILFGGLVGWYTIQFIGAWIAAIQQGALPFDQTVYTGVVQKGNIALYVMTVFSVYFFPFGNRRHRFIIAGLLFLVVIGIDYLFVGDWWALPLAVLTSLIIVVTFAYAGAFAHLLAGIIANPG